MFFFLCVLALLLILPVLRFCSFRVQNSRFRWKGRFHDIFTGDSPFCSSCFCAFARGRHDKHPQRLRPFLQSIHVATILASTKTSSVFAEHPCGKHDNVHRLRPFLQSIHVTIMITYRKTLSVSAEHPYGNHDKVDKDSVHFCRASMWQP